MPVFEYTVHDSDGELLREGVGLFPDKQIAQRELVRREAHRQLQAEQGAATIPPGFIDERANEGANGVKVKVSERS